MSNGRPGVFLDRDGTLIEEVDFLRSPDELRMIPGAAAAVHRLNISGIPVCVISNQSGVARGYLTEEDLGPIHARLMSELWREGASLDRLYYCPHHPDGGIAPYNIECECRKPRPGMLYRGRDALELDLARSFVVGDSSVDIEAGNAVGATTILVLTGYGPQSLERCTEQGIRINHVAASVAGAVDFILETMKGATQRNA